MPGDHKWLLWKAFSFFILSHHTAMLIFPCNIHPGDQSQLIVVYHVRVYVFICKGLVRREHLMNRVERDPFFHVHFRCNKFDMY